MDCEVNKIMNLIIICVILNFIAVLACGFSTILNMNENDKRIPMFTFTLAIINLIFLITNVVRLMG